MTDDKIIKFNPGGDSPENLPRQASFELAKQLAITSGALMCMLSNYFGSEYVLRERNAGRDILDIYNQWAQEKNAEANRNKEDEKEERED